MIVKYTFSQLEHDINSFSFSLKYIMLLRIREKNIIINYKYLFRTQIQFKEKINFKYIKGILYLRVV